MPGQHARNREAVTFRLDGLVLAAARVKTGEQRETMTDVVDDKIAEYAGVAYDLEYDSEDSTFVATGLAPSVARRRARELYRDPDVMDVRLVLRQVVVTPV